MLLFTAQLAVRKGLGPVEAGPVSLMKEEFTCPLFCDAWD